MPLEAKKLFIFYGQVQEAKAQMKKAATVRTALEQHIAKTEDKKGKRQVRMDSTRPFKEDL